MALRSKNPADAEVTEPAVADPAVVETPTETVVADEVVDLEPLKGTVAGYLTSSDATEVKAAYAGLSRKGKTAATKYLQGAQEEALSGEDFAKAKSLLGLRKELQATPTKAPSAPKIAKNPTEVFITRVAVLNLAYNAAVSAVVDGLDENWQEQAAALAASPSPAIKEAVEKLVSRKLGTPKKDSDGPKRARHDVAKHIAEAFGQHPVGAEMDIQTIRSFDSSEYGEGNRPGAAAITAHLKNAKFAIDGLEVMKNAEGKATGVRKVA